MYQLSRSGGFTLSRTRSHVQKILYRHTDGRGVKLHVSKPAAAPETAVPGRMPGHQVFIVSASLVDEDGYALEDGDVPLVGPDRRVTIALAHGATLAQMRAFLHRAMPDETPAKAGHLLATGDNGTTSIRRFDGVGWQDWLTLPADATDAHILMADQLEHTLRQMACDMLDTGQKALALSALVPGL